MAANPHCDRAVAAGPALINDLAGEIVHDFASSARMGGERFAILAKGEHLLQRERIALDSGGGVGLAGAGCFCRAGSPDS